MIQEEKKLNDEETTAYMKQNYKRIWKGMEDQSIQKINGEPMYEEKTVRQLVQELL